ncbi:MAG: NUDIX hydrolase, partial [Actinobacteria bacterium]|nr:NUDIX hydrolase [Actinomycetota bacterium]
PAPSAGGEEIKKKRKRKRSRSKSSKRSHSNSSDNKRPNQGLKKPHKRAPYAKRVDEVSAGGLVIDKSRTQGLLIGRLDAKDPSRERLLWSLPKGHIDCANN